MVSLYDPCLVCRAKVNNGDTGDCPLPKLCLYDAYDEKEINSFSDKRIKAILLWESGLCIEDIAKDLGYVQTSSIYKIIISWRKRKKEAGLLI